MPTVRAIVRQAESGGYRFDALIAGVVSSTPFLERSADGAAAKVARED
jgi:hypothetical protein